jgi:hypothetical protein
MRVKAALTQAAGAQAAPIRLQRSRQAARRSLASQRRSAAAAKRQRVATNRMLTMAKRREQGAAANQRMIRRTIERPFRRLGNG